MEEIVLEKEKLRCLMEIIKSLKQQVYQMEIIIKELRVKTLEK